MWDGKNEVPGTTQKYSAQSQRKIIFEMKKII